MPISVFCLGCGKRFKAKDALAGKTVPCPVCGEKISIGAAPIKWKSEGELLPAGAAPSSEPAPAPRPDPVAKSNRNASPERRSGETSGGETRPPAASRAPPALRLKAPPPWLRHLHWLLVLSLIPLAISLLQSREREDFVQRLIETLADSPDQPDSETSDGGEQLASPDSDDPTLEEDATVEDLFAMLPDHKLRGALLPRDSWLHWLFTLAATALFFTFLSALCLEGSAKPQHLLLVGLFTSTFGILFLLVLQAVANWSQGVVIVPRSIVGIVLVIIQLIGLSYSAAADPEYGFWLSLVGFTLGVGLCEELCKALPIIVRYRKPHDQWLGGYLWGLASGAGFGLAEGVIYASDYYNGITGIGSYLVRNISCVALHAVWTGSVAITIHRRQHLFQEEMPWHGWLLRALIVVAVPMVLHGLYDTLLKKEMSALALLVAIASFFFLAYQISQLRGVDDVVAHTNVMRDYLRRRSSKA